MNVMKKRGNGRGTAVKLSGTRSKPYVARILIGKDIDGKPLYYDIDTFETELETLVCLENYHKAPYPLYVKEEKYSRIVTFPQKPYPLVSVGNPQKNIIEKVKKDNYTFKQLYRDFEKEKLLSSEEEKEAKKYHIVPDGKFGYCYSRGLKTAFNNSKGLHDKVYKDLRTSDFQNYLKESGKGVDPQRQMRNLFLNLDKYAIQEDIIEKGYSQFISVENVRQQINKAKNITFQSQKIFTYEQIEYLWNFNPKSDGRQKEQKIEREIFIRDFWLMLIYTGCRAEELIFTYTKNIFLDKNFFVTGLKTEAGINREIPIHPHIKQLFEKYYNINNEFLFMQPNGNKVDYDYYLWHYKHNFKELHPFVSEHTAHDARHTLRTELDKINVMQIIINSIIGHSNDDVGKDVYTHITIEEKLEAIKLITYKEHKKLYILASNQ